MIPHLDGQPLQKLTLELANWFLVLWEKGQHGVHESSRAAVSQPRVMN